MINNPQNFFDQVRNLCEELGLKMKTLTESIASLLSKSDAESTYLKKTDAQSAYLGKTAKAESAKTADTATTATSATKATQDGNGAVISSTYLKSATASSTYLSKSDAQATYLGKDAKAQSATFADSATTATSATSALKATQDGDGNVISGTYLKNANAESTYLTKSDASSTYLAKSGNRGVLAGYETSGTTTAIDANSPDSNEANSDVTVANGSVGTAWTKVVRITANVTVTLGSAWEWVGREAPTISAGGVLVLCWCGNGGVANFVSLDA